MIEFALHFILVKKNEKEYMKTKEEIEANEIATSFAFDKKGAVDFFYNLAKIKHSAVKRTNYVLIDNKNDESNENKTVLFPNFSLSKFMPQDLVEILNKLKRTNYTKLVVCAYEISKEAMILSSQIESVNIILLDKFDTYNKLLKPYNFFPENIISLKKSKKLKLKEIVSNSLNKKRSKGYFLASIVLLFSSFIFKMNLYYVITSSVLLLLSLISFILPKYNTIKEEEII